MTVGAADSVDDAFDRYLANRRPRLRAQGAPDRPPTWPGWPWPPAGWPSWPTPTAWASTAADLARVVGELAEAGFGGIEAVYGRYSARQRRDLGNLARRFDLVATGGSDHHGSIKPDLRGRAPARATSRCPTGCSTSCEAAGGPAA